MRFSRLRLLGFKSFVDPTELVIADGLTGVVGPNGCGKSNLLEALRWVMGENRPTAMRGAGMEDVIFNGASTRPARHFAEVTLAIDNYERLAPAAFNQDDTIEVIRRITRDAGSAYKVSGRDTRARDVQMLFADASTGAHSPALVRQGMISELVNARPKARRRILEEAAGISGLYQRRHEAELKLNGTEVNLARVEDVLENLRNQMSSLARQARQAARYREIADDLKRGEGILLFRRWAEAQATWQAALAELSNAAKQAAAAQTEAARSGSARRDAEAKVPPLREEAAIAGAVLQRLLVERDGLDDAEKRALGTIETLDARRAQLESDKIREAALGHDAEETISRLDWEKGELEKASAGAEARQDEASSAAELAGADLVGQEAALDRATEDLARLDARQQSLERRFEEAKQQNDAAAKELEAANRSVVTAEAGIEEAKERVETANVTNRAAQEEAVRAEATLGRAEAARTEAQTTEAELRAVMSERDGEATALRAEAQALERLIARDRSDADHLLDRITVASGYEAALGAALGDDLKAPEVSVPEQTGWRGLADYDARDSLPGKAAPLSDHVSNDAALLRRLGRVGIVDAADGDRLQADLAPGQRLVSLQGDMWRWDGFRQSAADSPSTAALQLQQRNRLNELTSALATAESSLADARARHQEIAAALKSATEAERTARNARKTADGAANDALRAVSRADADMSMLKGRLETQTHLQERRAEDATRAADALKLAETGLGEVGDLSVERAEIETLRSAVETARAAMLEARARSDDLRRETETRIKRLQEITQEMSGWQLRQQNAGKRLAELDARIEETTHSLDAARSAPADIALQRDKLAGSIDAAQSRQRNAEDVLVAAESALKATEQAERDSERRAADAREARARAEAVAEAGEVQTNNAAERIQEDMDVTPEGLLDELDIDPEKMPSAERAEADVVRLRRQREALGAVNLRAEEDSKEVESEHNELVSERDDLVSAVAKLKDGIESLNKEGRQRLLDAFEEVNGNFSKLFRHLFDGGEANLVLVESDDPLEAGLEIMCQPPGKKLSTLSLLSGGEQTLTAMALIFAVFLANPSPICVLDEVDAPLDDANVTRFCDLLDEMTRNTDTRFLIITHHSITMSRMNRLFGVTMAEQGVSQLVSVDLQQAEEIVA